MLRTSYSTPHIISLFGEYVNQPAPRRYGHHLRSARSTFHLPHAANTPRPTSTGEDGQTSSATIPDQIAIVGVDNETEICETLQPMLSSVLPDFESAGYQAADLAIRLMNGENARKAVHAYGVKAIVERESTQDLKCGGRLISRADEYIRSNYTQKLNVGKVAEALKVSRRLLELRFRTILGCSVLERITAIRIADAKSKLERTNLPVDEIAIGCGYRTARAFRTAFMSATGLTPLAYRFKMLRDGTRKVAEG